MSKTYSRSDAIVRAQEEREEREAERFLQFMQQHAELVEDGCLSVHPDECRCGDCLTYLAGEVYAPKDDENPFVAPHRLATTERDAVELYSMATRLLALLDMYDIESLKLCVESLAEEAARAKGRDYLRDAHLMHAMQRLIEKHVNRRMESE